MICFFFKWMLNREENKGVLNEHLCKLIYSIAFYTPITKFIDSFHRYFEGTYYAEAL